MTSERIAVGPPGTPHYHVEIRAGLLADLHGVLDRHGVGLRRMVASTGPVWRAVRPALPATAPTAGAGGDLTARREDDRYRPS